MQPPDEPGGPRSGDAHDRPDETADQRLADLLDACLRAEDSVPGSSAEIIRGAPQEMRLDLEQLLRLALALRRRSSSISLPDAASQQALKSRIIDRVAQRSGAQISAGATRTRLPRVLSGLWRGIVARFARGTKWRW